MKNATLLTLLALAFACGAPPQIEPPERDGPLPIQPEQPPAEQPEEILELVATLAPIAPEVFLGEEVILDARNTTGGTFNAIWFVQEPEDCPAALPDDPQAIATRLRVECLGTWTVSLQATPLSGGPVSVVETSFDVVLRDGIFDIELVEVISAPLGGEAVIRLNYDSSQIPAVLLTGDPLVIEASAGEGTITPPEFTLSGDRTEVRVVMNEAHGSWNFSFELVAGPHRSSVPVEVAVTALNTAPEVEAASASAFLVGEPVIITAQASDVDGDEVTCELAFASDNPGPEFALPASTGDCTFTVLPPPVLTGWALVILATDEFGGQDDDENRVAIAPNNSAPVLAPLAIGDVAEVAYACNATTCTSDELVLDIEASDDVDAADALLYEVIALNVERGDISIVADETVAGRFHISLSRDDVGALAGESQLQVRVTEATTFAALPPLSATEEFTLRVTNTAPTVSGGVSDDVDHTYDGVFRASINLDFDFADAENNAQAFARLVRCPGDVFANGNTNVCGSVRVDSVDKTGNSLRFDFDSDELAPLVGEMEFEVFAIDADGSRSTSQTVRAEIGNRAPTLAASTNIFIDQTPRGNGDHFVSFFVASDEDGDPLDLSALTLECPTNPCTARLQETSPGVVTLEGPGAPELLGTYRVRGTVSDGQANSAANLVRTMTNVAPRFLADLQGSGGTRNHLTLDGIVTNDPNEALFNCIGLADDTDPVILEAVGGPVVFQSQPVSGTFSAPYGLQMTYDDFVARFAATVGTTSGSGFQVSFRLVDVFGASSDVVVLNPRLGNRQVAPLEVTNLLNLDSLNGAVRFFRQTFLGQTLVNNEQVIPLERRVVSGVITKLAAIGCGAPIGATTCRMIMKASISVIALDPDGDPLEVQYTGGLANSLPTGFNPLVEDRDFEIFPSVATLCAGGLRAFVPVTATNEFSGRFNQSITIRLRDHSGLVVRAGSADGFVNAGSNAAPTKCIF